jgi:hypothetical protein
MRILVVGEGPHDIGRRAEWSERTRTRVALPGWLHAALEKLRDPAKLIEVVALRRNEIVLTDRQRRKNMPLPKGHGERALASMFRAEAGKYDVVIFMADADTKDQAAWQEHHDNISEGFKRGPSGPAPVICLPKSASESWLLADPAAWCALGLTKMSILPTNPEDTWGDRHNPESRHPKHEFERAARCARLEGDGRDQRVQVMEHSDMHVIASSCPLSFVSFWSDCTAAGFADLPPSPGKAP